MKSEYSLSKLFLSVFCAALIGCGTWLGNPKEPGDESGGTSKDISNVNLSIKGSDAAAALTQKTIPVIGVDGSNIGNFILDEAYVVLKEIELASSTREGDGEIDFEGPYLVNLITNVITPQTPQVELTPGFYDTIKLKLEKLDEEDGEAFTGAPSGIAERSIFLSGTYDDGSSTIDITLTFELSEEFELTDGLNGINLVGGETQSILVQFFLARWFDFSNEETNSSDLDFSDLTGSMVTLSEDSDDDDLKDIHEAIKEAIKESADFAEDKDGDGELEEEEKETEDGSDEEDEED